MHFKPRTAVAFNASLWISLPSDWVKYVLLKKGQRVEVQLLKDGSLRIYPESEQTRI